MTRRRKNPIPILLLWSKKEQRRFCDAVERFVSCANDLQLLVTELRAQHATSKPRRPRSAPEPQPATIGTNGL